MIKEKLKEIKVDTLLLVNGEKIKKVEKFKEDLLDKFGIKNQTSEYLEEKLKENKTNCAINLIKDNLIKTFGIYKVVEYKDMDQICKEYNLYMTSLSNYSKVIPEENLIELNDFTDNLKNFDKNTLDKLYTYKKGSFLFDFEMNRLHNKPISKADFSDMFYIMCPKSHIKKSKNNFSIGREINNLRVDKPKFTYKFELNLPEPKDPIIFLPFKILDSVFCVIVTAWDKVADDLRIRQMV